GEDIKAVARDEYQEHFLVARGTGLLRRGVSCSATSIHVDARADSYARRQRGIDRGSLGAGSRTSTGVPSMGHARASGIDAAGRKCCGADQFFVSVFWCACLRNRYSCCGRATDYGFVVAAPRRQNKAAQQSRKIEDSTDRFFIFAPAVGAGLLMTFS